jgi:glucokinase
MFTFPILIGDIGGTYSRFAIQPGPDEPLSDLVTTATTLHAEPTLAIRAALEKLGGPRPCSAFFGVAGRVSAPVVHLTNASWIVDAGQIGSALGLSKVVLVNDYIPVAAATVILNPQRSDEIVQIGQVAPSEQGPRLALGPGTGLGSAVCMPLQGRYWLQSTEAGHVDFGACEPDELALWPLIDHVKGRVAAETVLSGSGIIRLYTAYARRNRTQPTLRTPAEILKAAATGQDESALEAIRLFSSLLGRFAGDLALIFGASGGVFLGSGIPRRIVSTLDDGSFRVAFQRKAPFEAAMRKIPTFVITSPEPGMSGLASIASNPDRFLFETHEWLAPDVHITSR